MLKTRVARPGALQIVFHIDMQHAQTFALELNLIAVHEWVQTAVIGAGGQHIARLQSMDRAHPLDATRNLVRHVVGVEILFDDTVDLERDLHFLRVFDFVGGDEERPHRRIGIARFHLIEHVGGRRQAARGTIDEIHIAENVLHGIGGLDLARTLAYHQRQLGLAFKNGGRDVFEDHGVPIANHAARRFMKSINGRRLATRAVFHVIHRHAINVVGARQRRAQAHRLQRHARSSSHGGFEFAAVGVKVLDQATNQIVRTGMRNILHHRRHINHVVTLDDTQLEIIEITNLHYALPD